MVERTVIFTIGTLHHYCYFMYLLIPNLKFFKIFNYIPRLVAVSNGNFQIWVVVTMGYEPQHFLYK